MSLEDGLVFLKLSGGKKLKDYANEYLNCGLQKIPDFIGKKGTTYFVGEAKYIGDKGGNQDKSIEDALSLARKATSAMMVAVLDGVVWLESSGPSMWGKLKNFSGNALSALLLNEFFTPIS